MWRSQWSTIIYAWCCWHLDDGPEAQRASGNRHAPRNVEEGFFSRHLLRFAVTPVSSEVLMAAPVAVPVVILVGMPPPRSSRPPLSRSAIQHSLLRQGKTGVVTLLQGSRSGRVQRQAVSSATNSGVITVVALPVEDGQREPDADDDFI